ncbi:unnamed protein product [Protopolystoma xenopodis]|uniref:Uncharacterized protein n=1 Tax=Protopolystoma xenopodis TaxID=117903 RepID=A0A448WFQ1_9PLAT|nr:unnamed protein product [Protopolystoma xenopodis]
MSLLLLIGYALHNTVQNKQANRFSGSASGRIGPTTLSNPTIHHLSGPSLLGVPCLNFPAASSASGSSRLGLGSSFGSPLLGDNNVSGFLRLGHSTHIGAVRSGVGSNNSGISDSNTLPELLFASDEARVSYSNRHRRGQHHHRPYQQQQQHIIVLGNIDSREHVNQHHHNGRLGQIKQPTGIPPNIGSALNLSEQLRKRHQIADVHSAASSILAGTSGQQLTCLDVWHMT